MKYLTKDDILLIHSIIIDETGGAHGVRDRNALLTLEALPQQKAFGRDLYYTPFLKAAVYARNIIMGHPFLDGNKRTGMTAAAVFLENQGYLFQAKEGEIKKCALTIIKEKLDLETIAAWFEKHSKKIKK